MNTIQTIKDRLEALEKQRVKISLTYDYLFECVVVEALDDHVHVWYRTNNLKDFDLSRFVRYEHIVYVEPT